MLLEKQVKKGDIVTIKLTTGEELIARYESDGAGEISISKPIVLAPGHQGIGMVPWLMSGEPTSVSLNKQIVITHCLTQKEIADKYIEATTNIKLS